MSVLENFKNILRSPYGGRQGSNIIFSSLNLQRSPWRKKKEGGLSPPPNGRQAPVAHPRGDRPLSPVGGATGSCVLALPTKPIEFHSSSVRRFIVIYLQKNLEIEFELS